MMLVGESPSIPSRCLEGKMGAASEDVIKAGLIEAGRAARKRASKRLWRSLCPAPGFVHGDARAPVYATQNPKARAFDTPRQGAEVERAGDAGLYRTGPAFPGKPDLSTH